MSPMDTGAIIRSRTAEEKRFSISREISAVRLSTRSNRHVLRIDLWPSSAVNEDWIQSL
jgi:hypothetical protein